MWPGVGGRIGQITVAGRRLLRGRTDAPDDWSTWGSYPLLPWSNRIRAGVFSFEGRTCRVPVNFDDGSAIHGLTAARPWEVVARSDTAAELALRVEEGCYRVAGRQVFELDDGALRQTLEVVNENGQRVPVGLGIHPWFVGGYVRVPADMFWPGAGPVPTGLPVPVGTDEDLRVGRVPPLMDRCYTALTGTSVDVPGVRLHWSDTVTQVVVFTGVPGWVCVEPVTMSNDGFRHFEEGAAGTGVAVLDPGARFAVSYRFEFLR